MPVPRRGPKDPDRSVGSQQQAVPPTTPPRVRAFGQSFARSAWRRSRLFTIVVLFVVAATLGWIGWSESMTAAGQQPSVSDLLYRVVSLFRFGDVAVPPPVPWQLDVARWLAIAAILYAVFTAAAAFLREGWSAFRATWFSGHVVVCGLGPVGMRLVEGLRASGHRVVAVERDRKNPRISACRALGAVVLIGDAGHHDVLRSARVDHASYLFAMTDQDAANAEIALAAKVLSRERKGSALTCFINMNVLVLNAVLKQFAIGHGTSSTFRLEPFSVSERSARALLDKHPVVDEDARGPVRQPHVVVVGTGDVASELAVEVARRWRKFRGDSSDRIRITVVGDKAVERVAAIMERHPQLNKEHARAVAEITAWSMSLDSAAFTAAAFLRDGDNAVSATVIYVCVGDDARGLGAGIHLRNRLEPIDIRIVVGTDTERSGVASLLHAEHEGEVQGRMHVFGMLDCLGDTDVVLRGNNETVAQAIHADYVAQESALGTTRETNPRVVPWTVLPPDYKDANRQAAADVGRKLAAIECTLAPLKSWDEDELELEPAEVEVLARMEHDRWLEVHEATGWRWAATRSPARKEHPDMKPYAELSEDRKEPNRVQVRRIPHFLHDLEFSVVRLQDGAPDG